MQLFFTAGKKIQSCPMPHLPIKANYRYYINNKKRYVYYNRRIGLTPQIKGEPGKTVERCAYTVALASPLNDSEREEAWGKS